MSIILSVVLVCLGWAALTFAMQRPTMFPTSIIASGNASTNGVPDGVELVWIPVAEGRVEAWFLTAHGEGPLPAVIFAHGNAELIDHNLMLARSLNALGLSVLLVEYPGYGRSDGEPSRRSISEVFLAAYDWLAGQPNIDREGIAGMGRSLGGGAITDLARERPLRALVLQSTFTSVADFAKWYLIPAGLVRDPFDNLDLLRTFTGPVLLIHGRKDRVIPHANSERLASAAPAAQLLSLDCGHNDCPPDWGSYLAELKDFFVRSNVSPAKPES